MAKKSKFQGEFGGINQYNQVVLRKAHTVKELRKEYQKLRKEAKERIKILKNSDFSTAQILENKEYLKKDPARMTKRELSASLSYTASFLSTDLSTVEGQKQYRENVIQTFKDMGYTEINDKNFKEFDKFMKDSAVYIKNQIIGSPELLEMFQKAKENNISIANMKKNLTFYREHMEEIEELDLNSDRKRKYTMNEIEKIFKKRREQGK